MCKWLTLVVLGFWLGGGLAREAVPVAADPVAEARVQKLAEQLRCLVCQNQNLADSHADLAEDLKSQVREMVQKGLSDREIIDYLVQRYGDFVLYRPPVKATTWLLWAGPFALLAVALSVLAARLRRRRDVAALSEKERAAARRLLGDDEGERA
ncbi:MAG: cytochrome c-type biogenesis protein CcmH [Azonexus sp.]|nr:cytochrome c-type biogenesis protein CcmH [Betaproteobacteria bacterium]MBK8917796.1 cytochrome c-type biogenesis protein CcmH [Betaproteobacteria bacterium]MBP6035883.1 cytochrome c-type biogenesis protein CcmH [Azonexus sp.]MBP6906299.1 cytochrome c-type biogenesis protein CcmH [Azonexus sp.]